MALEIAPVQDDAARSTSVQAPLRPVAIPMTDPWSEGCNWSAIVLAGQRPGIDLLASLFSLESKACVPLLGKPMAAWVIETLLATPQIGNIIILAQDREMGRAPGLAELIDDYRVTFAKSIGEISQSISNVVGKAPLDWLVLITTADHPLLTVDIVSAFIDGTGVSDLAVGTVERRTLLQRCPTSKRTWLEFRCGAYSGKLVCIAQP